MILRGIIRGVPTGNVSIVDGKEIIDNRYKVEIPSLKTSQNSITTKSSAFFMDALLSYQPGNLNTYSIGEVVFLSITDQESLPIIIGKMYIGDNEKATDNINANTLSVVGQATLSKNTTIGELTYSDLDGALRRLSNVENVLDNLEEHYIPSLNNYLKKDITELATLTTNVPNEQAYAYVYANNIPYKITLNDLADRVITTVNSGETKDLNINQYGFIEIEGE